MAEMMDIDHIQVYSYRLTDLQVRFIQQFGFQPISPQLPPQPGHTTQWVARGQVVLALSAPTAPPVPDSAQPSAIAQYLRHHPPGIVDIAWRVDHLDVAIETAIAAGATLLQAPQTRPPQPGLIQRWATVSGLGDLRHTLVERRSGQLGSLPGEVATGWSGRGTAALSADSRFSLTSGRSSHSLQIDHAVINVPQGQLDAAITWYQRAFGLEPQQSFQIETAYSGLRSRVLQHPQGGAQLPINEPTSARSQIQEFLEHNRGIGVQHLALCTPNLTQTVSELRQRSVKFLPIPETYYTLLQRRGGRQQWPDLNWAEIARQGILVDWADDARTAPLLQIFTQPIFAEPTFFFEFIQRGLPVTHSPLRPATGFGEGNFQALFEAIEQAQVQRQS